MKREDAENLFRTVVRSIRPLPDEMLAQLLQISRVVRYKKGETFLMAGEVPLSMGFNLDGYFRLFYIDSSGNDWTKGFAIPGNILLSYSALVQNRPSYFSIEAIQDSSILQFEYSRWMEMIGKDHRWYPFIYEILQSVYIKKEMREKSFLTDDAMTRYINFQKEYPGLEKIIKLYHAASFIGITPEALSRIRKKIKNDPPRQESGNGLI